MTEDRLEMLPWGAAAAAAGGSPSPLPFEVPALESAIAPCGATRAGEEAAAIRYRAGDE